MTIGGTVLRRLAQPLSRYPFVTNLIVTGSLYAAGDISQQLLLGNKKPDFKSASRIGLVGGLVLAPIYIPWYKFLDYLIPGKVMTAVLGKCLMDQCILAPVTVSLFFIATSILERQPDMFASLKARGMNAYLTGCLFWPPAQAINFSLVPGQYRIVYVACVSFVWTNILCYIKSKKLKKTQDLSSVESSR